MAQGIEEMINDAAQMAMKYSPETSAKEKVALASKLREIAGYLKRFDALDDVRIEGEKARVAERLEKLAGKLVSDKPPKQKEIALALEAASNFASENESSFSKNPAIGQMIAKKDTLKTTPTLVQMSEEKAEDLTRLAAIRGTVEQFKEDASPKEIISVLVNLKKAMGGLKMMPNTRNKLIGDIESVVEATDVASVRYNGPRLVHMVRDFAEDYQEKLDKKK